MTKVEELKESEKIMKYFVQNIVDENKNEWKVMEFSDVLDLHSFQ